MVVWVRKRGILMSIFSFIKIINKFCFIAEQRAERKRARVTALKYSVIEKGFENFFVSLSLPSRHLLHSFVRVI